MKRDDVALGAKGLPAIGRAGLPAYGGLQFRFIVGIAKNMFRFTATLGRYGLSGRLVPS